MDTMAANLFTSWYRVNCLLFPFLQVQRIECHESKVNLSGGIYNEVTLQQR